MYVIANGHMNQIEVWISDLLVESIQTFAENNFGLFIVDHFQNPAFVFHEKG